MKYFLFSVSICKGIMTVTLPGGVAVMQITEEQ
jgi:hypothetical protein